jgi:hypothetical protein
MNAPIRTSGRAKAYLIVVLLAAFIGAYGLIVYFAVGTRSPAEWDFGARQDVPGEGPDSTHEYSTAYLNKPLITYFLMWISPDLERMRRTEVQRPYEYQTPPRPAGAVEVDGGEAQYRFAPLGSLKNPIPADVASVKRGRTAYVYFCIPCHGSQYNGDGTVGQSFHPLPSDLQSPRVQGMSDDEMFRRLSYGKEFSGPPSKAPPLYYTVAVADRWHIVNFIRSLGVRRPSGEPHPSGDFTGKTYYPPETVARHPQLPE